MSVFYGSNAALGLQYGVSQGFRPAMVPSTESSRCTRFHPYLRYNVNDENNANTSKRYQHHQLRHSPTFDIYGVNQTTSYSAENGCVSGADTLLRNTLFHQYFLSFYTGEKPTTLPLTLQELCYTASEPGTNPFSSAKKDQSHPFYWRKRVEPADGMTRTRDKYRVVYTEKQRRGLEHEFSNNKFITIKKKKEIAEKLSLSERQIKIWFQNRRAKDRRDCRKVRDKEQPECHNITEYDDNDNNHMDSSTLAHADYFNSCRFAGRYNRAEENKFSGQCRYLNQTHSENKTLQKYTSTIPRLDVTYPVPYSEWNTSPSNGFVPALHISPLTVNSDFGCGSRL